MNRRRRVAARAGAARFGLGVLMLSSCLAALAPRTASAADIYLWTDEAGRTHLADNVPARFRKSAIRVDSRQFELGPEQRREAVQARAALERQASAAAAAASRAAASATLAAAPRRAPVATAPGSAGRRLGEGDSATCEALQREYQDSLDCFAPYMNANGSIKPGAFAACRSVVNPTLKCGSPKAY